MKRFFSSFLCLVSLFSVAALEVSAEDGTLKLAKVGDEGITVYIIIAGVALVVAVVLAIIRRRK